MFKFPGRLAALVGPGVQRYRILQVTQYRPFSRARSSF
jgi:hypothetical protein